MSASIDRAAFAERRRRLFERMPESSAAIVCAGPRVERTNDTYYRFRPRSHFYYLTGFAEPEACAVLLRRASQLEYLLFCPPREPDREAWNGARAGADGAVRDYGADRAFSVERLDAEMPGLLDGVRRIYYPFGQDPWLHEQVGRWIRPLQQRARRSACAPTELVHLESLLANLRAHKTAEELALLRRAAAITSAGMVRAMRAARPGMREYELEAELVHEFVRSGAQPSFAGVVCSGTAGCLSHYRERNDGVLRDGDLVILDAGAEVDCYTADLTATFPTNGRFSGEQKALYELVLGIERALVKMVRPGVTFGDLEAVVPRMVIEGLLAIGAVRGSLDELIDRGAHRRFFMHNVGHWLGMDIHDEAPYAEAHGWCPLAPGMVLTVEPGLYLRADLAEVDPRFRNLGARIEDDLVVTADGCQLLSTALPREIAEIETLMREGGGA
jgi:Xaa-Pro aminopeptidase